MLQIIQFENGRYGLQNQWTGIVLPKTFRTQHGARRHRARLTRKFNRSIANINNRMNKYSQ